MKVWLVASFAVLFFQTATTDAWAQLERSQTFLVSQSEAHSQASRLFDQLKSRALSNGTLISVGDRYDRVKRIAERIIAAAREHRPDSASWAWEVIYVDEAIENAYCLPGGKITIYSGLIDKLSLSEDEIASIIGHEVGHALREHGREKRSNAQVANVAVSLLAIAAGIAGYKNKIDPAIAMNATRLVGGAMTSVFFLLPNSREMEVEADAIGVELAARAGYEPGAAQDIWRKMASNSRIEFLSTHPSSVTRIGELTPIVARARDIYSQRLLRPPERQPQLAESGLLSTPERIPSAMASSTSCELPGGAIETLALLACQRLGGISGRKLNETRNTLIVGCNAVVNRLHDVQVQQSRFSLRS